KSVDRALVSRCRFWLAAGAHVRDGCRLNPGLLGNWRVRVPLVLRAPDAGRAKDREFRKARRQRRLVAAISAEFLGDEADLRRVHPCRERAARGNRSPAGTRAKGRQQCALVLVHLIFVEYSETRLGTLGG